MCFSRNAMIDQYETMDPGVEHDQAKEDHFDAIDAFELAQEDCLECGGLGYTIEGQNSEDGEVMVGCRLCWIRHQDANIPTLSLDMEVEQQHQAAAHAA